MSIAPSAHSSRLSVAALQAENQRLKHQLDDMLGEARTNQSKLSRFDQLERQLIAAPSLSMLFNTLLQDYRVLFGLDVVTLALLDPYQEIAELLAAETATAQPTQGLVWLLDDKALHTLHGAAGRHPKLATPGPEHELLFDGATRGLKSIAMLPLVLRGQCMGSLNLGSRDPARFGSDSSTDFLARLAELVTVCLYSALATERLKVAGLTDALTCVHNRRYFDTRLHEEVQAARRNGQPLACLFIDVDHFKQFNDTRGHPAGDQALRQVAHLIKTQLRGSDVVARYGGEEFVVLLPATPMQRALETAERIRRSVAEHPVSLSGGEIKAQVTVSIGVALCHCEDKGEASTLAADMVQRADQAVYAAKAAGRNQVLGAD